MIDHLNLLHDLTLKITKAEDFNSALNIVLQKICETTGWAYGEAWVPTSDGKKLICDRAWHFESEKLEIFKNANKTITFSRGVGLPGRVWSSGKPAWVLDVTSDLNFPRASIAKACGLKSGIGIPIMNDDEFVAVIEFFTREVLEEDKQLVNLIMTVALELGNIIKYKQMEEKLRKLSQAVEQSISSIVITDTEGNIEYVNPKFTEITGYAYEETMGKNPRILKSGKTTPQEYKALWNSIINGKSWQGEFYNKRKNGKYYWELAQITPLKDKEGNITNFLAIKEDITNIKRSQREQAELKEQLYHAQKLDSIGRLAGGVAHDFNNFLMAIIGYANLLEFEIKDNVRAKEYIGNIVNTAHKAANLTQSMLAFGRKQVLKMEPVNLNEVINTAEILYKRFINENVDYKLELSKENIILKADANKIEQVLLNLVTNSIHAMTEGGVLRIKTDIEEIDTTFTEKHGFGREGTYALISVNDTGIGMDRETKGKIFEPFFTTKEAGKGTGLGLSIVYGIVKQHNGFIDVHSEPGKGTTAFIYLPLASEMVIKEPHSETEISDVFQVSPETIMVAEDDESVRYLLKEILERFGYKVTVASNGKEAVDKFIEQKENIHLLILDVKMPVMNGKEAYDEIRKIKPEMKAIFLSGYSDDIIDQDTILKEDISFLQKPVLPTQLVKTVKHIIGK
ncbi:MAG: PAS domain S-box protein [Candidatus Kuenenia sp.]|nr:PAS domain S-box protein [Candidatus Kuenenia hertensis]